MNPPNDIELDNFHNKIGNILKNSYLTEITDLSTWRFHWRKISNISDCASKILVGSGSIVAFTESYFRTGYLSLVAGSLGTFGLVARQFAVYSHNQSKSRELNLKKNLTREYEFLLKFIQAGTNPASHLHDSNQDGTPDSNQAGHEDSPEIIVMSDGNII